jgi:hypothetical protein
MASADRGGKSTLAVEASVASCTSTMGRAAVLESVLITKGLQVWLTAPCNTWLKRQS